MNKAPRIIPPFYLLLALIAIALQCKYMPGPHFMSTPWTYGGVIMMIAGLFIMSSNALKFRRAGTRVRPGPESTVLVIDGAYRYTRNPMYVGFVLIAFGAAVLTGSLFPMFIPLVLMGILHTQYIMHEERWMEESFGTQYVDYKKTVRRWL